MELNDKIVIYRKPHGREGHDGEGRRKSDKQEQLRDA